MTGRMRIVAAEAFGTGFLVLGGCGTAVLAGNKVGFGGVAAAFGLSLLIMAYAIGPITGCHINPAVTIGLAAARKTPWEETPFYVGGQLVGGLIGALILFAIAHGVKGFSASATGFASNGFADHSPGGYNLASVAVTEIVMTAFLLFTVVSTLHRKFSIGFGGLAAGLVLALVHLISIPVDNTSVNPARSLAVGVFQGEWALEQLWVFIVFPVIGGVVGAVLFLVLAGREAEIPLAETTAQ